VPAMFMVMDDLGALIWRFGKRLIVHSADAEADHQPPGPASTETPPALPNSMHPAAE